MLAAGAIALCGYLCASCPSAPSPSTLVTSIHPAYTRVVFAFAGWDATGTVLNQWDDVSKNFTLTRGIVASLQSQGRSVLISLGGGAGAPLPGPAPAGFVTNVVTGLSSLVTSLGLDGVDFDIENFEGDPVAGMAAVREIVLGLRVAAAPRALLITCAPQMTDVFPDYTQETAGFNRYAPLVEERFLGNIDAVMPQMYNSWASVETIAYAVTYTKEVEAGFTVTAGAGPTPLNITIPPTKLWLGYPSSSSAAGSGFLPPTEVVAMVRGLAASGTPVAGLMTWSIAHQGCGASVNAGGQSVSSCTFAVVPVGSLPLLVMALPRLPLAMGFLALLAPSGQSRIAAASSARSSPRARRSSWWRICAHTVLQPTHLRTCIPSRAAIVAAALCVILPDDLAPVAAAKKFR